MPVSNKTNILDVLIDDNKTKKKSKKKSNTTKVPSIIPTHYPLPEDFNEYDPESDY